MRRGATKRHLETSRLQKSLNEKTCRTKAVTYARRTWTGLHHAVCPPLPSLPFPLRLPFPSPTTPYPLSPFSPPPSPPGAHTHTHAGPCTSAENPADRQSCVRTQSAVGLRCTASVSAAVIDQDSIPYLRPQRRTDPDTHGTHTHTRGSLQSVT